MISWTNLRKCGKRVFHRRDDVCRPSFTLRAASISNETEPDGKLAEITATVDQIQNNKHKRLTSVQRRTNERKGV